MTVVLGGPKVKLLVVEGCEPCAELEEVIKPLIEAGDIQVVDGLSDEGQKLLQDHREIDHVPYAFVEGSQPGAIRKCDIRQTEDGTIMFECKEETPRNTTIKESQRSASEESNGASS